MSDQYIYENIESYVKSLNDDKKYICKVVGDINEKYSDKAFKIEVNENNIAYCFVSEGVSGTIPIRSVYKEIDILKVLVLAREPIETYENIIFKLIVEDIFNRIFPY